MCLGNNQKERRIIGILIRFSTNYSWSKSLWKLLILPFAGRHWDVLNGKSRESLPYCRNGSRHTHSHTHTHTHTNIMEPELCVFPTLILSLIYFVSRNGFSSSTYQLTLFNTKLQVLDNPKSFDQSFWFHNADRYSTLVDRLSGSCGPRNRVVRHIAKSAERCLVAKEHWFVEEGGTYLVSHGLWVNCHHLISHERSTTPVWFNSQQDSFKQMSLLA